MHRGDTPAKLDHRATAVQRVTSNNSTSTASHGRSENRCPVLATGSAASPGAAQARWSFSRIEAEEMAKDGAKVVLVRLETSRRFYGMVAAQAMSPRAAVMTSHRTVAPPGGMARRACALLRSRSITASNNSVDGEVVPRVNGSQSTDRWAAFFLARYRRLNPPSVLIFTN